MLNNSTNIYRTNNQFIEHNKTSSNDFDNKNCTPRCSWNIAKVGLNHQSINQMTLEAKFLTWDWHKQVVGS